MPSSRGEDPVQSDGEVPMETAEQAARRIVETKYTTSTSATALKAMAPMAPMARRSSMRTALAISF